MDPGGDNSSGILVRLRGTIPSLRPAEQRVAQAVLADPQGVADRPIGVLARECGTSETTVLRFCRAIGLRGYPELRLALAREATREASREASRAGVARPLDGDISADDPLEEIVAKIGYSDSRAVAETAEHLDVAALERAVGAIVEARRVDLYGAGASGFVAADLHQKLHRIGLMAFAWQDFHSALTSAALLRKGDVAIGISHTGTTVDVLEALRLAADHGATTIAITNFHPSPITELADIVLKTAARETPFRSGAMGSRIAQLTVIDCLFVGVAARRTYDETLTALEDTYRAISSRRRK
ncbi:MurR/RpiR family transcriptional regulator [Planotetraspora kaengkrachanensis]|uniref:RpiR family transcriptional regulator n=1 Tax=Planotetraspora kaengkrachanensis TaxID=575193 RepID=A0A8J3PPY3_9ACTN|nr:MurR/RpiR family transcriptional regulator [Planotetraspora kaengkrachanensis]GIG77552.1 RpiR family transcriptional regulator [Planotetraspora kaengkrachanensis]